MAAGARHAAVAGKYRVVKKPTTELDTLRRHGVAVGYRDLEEVGRFYNGVGRWVVGDICQIAFRRARWRRIFFTSALEKHSHRRQRPQGHQSAVVFAQG